MPRYIGAWEVRKGDNILGFNKHGRCHTDGTYTGPPAVEKHRWLHPRFKAMKEYVETPSSIKLSMKVRYRCNNIQE